MGMLDYILGIRMDGKQAIGEANRVEKSIGGIGSSIKSVIGFFGAGFIARGLTRQINEMANWGSEIENLSKRMDVSADKVQEWQYAAAQTGTTIEALANGMRFVQQRMTEAEDGMSEATDAFTFFRFSVADLQKMRPEVVLEEIARRFKEMPASARKTDAAITLLGRSADQLFTAFREGLSASILEARQLGIVVEEDTIKRLDAAADKLVKLKAQFKAFTVDEATKLEGEAGLLDFLSNVLSGTSGRRRAGRSLAESGLGGYFDAIRAGGESKASQGIGAAGQKLVTDLLRGILEVEKKNLDANAGTERAVKDVL